MNEGVTTQRPGLSTWFRQLLGAETEPAGDYFERLRTTIELSAPLCNGCGS